jgi:uncharacterized membrane protein YjjP (DUF1212 family)
MRPYGGYHYNLGRETFLTPVDWEEGWPVFSPGLGRAPRQVEVPFLIGDPPAHERSGLVLPSDPRWTSLRGPANFFAPRGDGWLLRPSSATLADQTTPAFLGIRQEHVDAEVRVCLHPTLAEGEEAGLAVRQSEQSHLKFFVHKVAGSGLVATAVQVSDGRPSSSSVVVERFTYDAGLRRSLPSTGLFAGSWRESFAHNRMCDAPGRIVPLGKGFGLAHGLAHHPHAGGGENLEAEAHAIVRVGKALLNAGAGTYQVRAAMGQVAAALGIEWLQSHVTLSELTVTLFKGSDFRTQVGQVHSVNVNANKISELEHIASGLDKGVIPADVEYLVGQIDAEKPLYPIWLNALAAGIACSAVAFLNNAWWLAIFCVLVGACLGQLVRGLLARRNLNVYMSALGAALVAAFTYIGLVKGLGLLTHDMTDYSAGYVPALIFLVPGFPLVNAVLDLVKTDITAGLSRLTYAFMILLSAAAALIAVTWVVGVQPNPLPNPPLDAAAYWLLSALASFIGVTGWAIMFNTPWRGALTAGLVGMAANLARLALLTAAAPNWLSAAIACFLAGVLASLLARKLSLASVVIAVPAAIIMVPGAYAYRALISFYLADLEPLLTNSSAAIFTILGMAMGLSAAKLVTDKRWILDRRHVLGE